MSRVSFLVDGFNLYGSVVETFKRFSICTKWLDVKSLLSSYLHHIGRDAKLEEIYYFTAIPHYMKSYNPDKIKRHTDYVKCLESTGIIVNKGRFKEKKVFYKNSFCKVSLRKHEEKETDVAISTKLFELLYLDKCDFCAIVSGDTDLLPAVRMCQANFNTKNIFFIIPYVRSHSKELKKVAPDTFKMNYKNYIN